MNIRNDRPFVEQLKKAAVDMGAVEAQAISADEIVVDERVRLKCLAPLCSNYGVNLMCPPNILSVDEFRKIVARYHLALLLKFDNGAGQAPTGLVEQENLVNAWKTIRESPAGGAVSEYIDSLKRSQQHVCQILGKLESMCLKHGYPLAAGLAAGGCHLCDTCSGPGSACSHSFLARPSAEGLGVDVIQTATKAGVKLDFGSQDHASWLAILLID